MATRKIPARLAWAAAYRAARIACPNRADLAFQPTAKNWQETPRAVAEPAIYYAIQGALAALGAHDSRKGIGTWWRLSDVATRALRPVSDMREGLMVNVMNGFGMFQPLRAPSVPYHHNWPNNRLVRWMALDQRRRDLRRRMEARGLFLYDGGNHIRHLKAA